MLSGRDPRLSLLRPISLLLQHKCISSRTKSWSRHTLVKWKSNIPQAPVKPRNRVTLQAIFFLFEGKITVWGASRPLTFLIAAKALLGQDIGGFEADPTNGCHTALFCVPCVISTAGCGKDHVQGSREA